MIYKLSFFQIKVSGFQTRNSFEISAFAPMNCLDARGNSISGFYYVSIGSDLFYYQISTLSLIAYVKKLSPSYDSIMTQASSTYFSDSYFSGYFSTLMDPIIPYLSFSNAVSFILPLDSEQSCIQQMYDTLPNLILTEANYDYGTSLSLTQIDKSSSTFLSSLAVTSQSMQNKITPTPSDWCQFDDYLQYPTSTEATYNLGSSQLHFYPTFDFTTTCSDLSYTYTASFADSGLPLPSFISLTQSTGKFALFTTLPSNLGTYLINVTATINLGISKWQVITFNVVKVCDTEILGFPLDYVINYDIGQGLRPLLDLNWTYSNSSCPYLEYKILYANNQSQANTQIFIVTSQKTFIKTSSVQMAGLHNMILRGFSDTYYVDQEFQVEIVDCHNAVIINSQIQDMQYYIGQSAAFSNFQDWNYSSPFNCLQFSYKAYLNSSLPLPDFISFSPSNRQFTVSSFNYSQSGIYTVTLVATLQQIYNYPMTFQVSLRPQIRFASDLLDQFVTIGVNSSYPLPSVVGIALNQFQVLFPNLPTFIKASYTTVQNQTLAFFPSEAQQIGTYQIIVKLQELQPFTEFKLFYIRVIVSGPAFNISSENKTLSIIENKTNLNPQIAKNMTNHLENPLSTPESDSPDSILTASNARSTIAKIIASQNKNYSLSSSISSISSAGLTTIKFSEDISLQYQNISLNQLNSTTKFLKISYLPNKIDSLSVQTPTLQHWEVKQIQGQELLIHLHFDQPLYVSQQSV